MFYSSVGTFLHIFQMCVSRDADRASMLTSAESCRDRSPLRARPGDGAVWSLKSQPGLVYICLLENTEQMRSNTLLLHGDAALAGCSRICCGFLPLTYPPQFTFSSFLFLVFIFNFHTSLYGVLQVLFHLFCARWSPHNRSTEDFISTKD